MTHNGMGDDEITVADCYRAFDNLPAVVRKEIREAKLPWNPIMFAELCNVGNAPRAVAEIIRKMDKQYMRLETAKEYGASHPEA